MKRILFCALGLIAALYSLGAGDFLVSGVSDTTVSLSAGAGGAPAFVYNLEEYANLRFQTALGDYGTFYGAFNVLAVSGSGVETAQFLAQAKPATGLLSTVLTVSDNYAAGIELERLYFRLKSDYLDLDAGLFRLAFGYGQVFGPSDFLSHRNPLFPDARLPAILGACLTVYPGDAKLRAFAAAPRNPLNAGGEGFRFGFSAENHGDWGSIQGLYAFESPLTGAPFGIHRVGFAAKVDWECGFVADLLYTYNHKKPTAKGLSASAGFDYSFLDGKLYILGEYLFSDEFSATASSPENPAGFSNRHYLYALVNYHINDYTAASFAYLAGLSDNSSVPSLSFEHDLFQGCTLNLTGKVFLDEDLFLHNEKRGEFGPVLTRNWFSLTTKLRIRF
ncbi:MAG: hypothetical protein LBO67_00835 [Spirochaetaceae bacterium]|jgi:hypothetical protein|nr:hypothetical protein [Spirochaetaceae bacterium]